MNPLFSRRNVLYASALVLAAILAAVFMYGLSPARVSATPAIFEIKSGDGFRDTAANLYAAGLIKSRLATEIYLLVSGRAPNLKPGLYKLSAADWATIEMSVIPP